MCWAQYLVHSISLISPSHSWNTAQLSGDTRWDTEKNSVIRGIYNMSLFSDGKQEMEEEMASIMPRRSFNNDEMDFDALLRQATTKLRAQKRKTWHQQQETNLTSATRDLQTHLLGSCSIWQATTKLPTQKQQMWHQQQPIAITLSLIH